ncbi:MAG: AAA family ATPase [Candidatus Thiodiazotropha sp. (ex. Lucinoma kazani)]
MGHPFTFCYFSQGRGYAITNEEDFDKPDEELEREEQSIGKDVLAIKGWGNSSVSRRPMPFGNLSKNWHVSDFHINLARGSKEAAGFDEHLSVTGDNLQLVAKNIYQNDPAIFQHIVDVMKRRVPGINNVVPLPTQDGRLLLSFHDGAFTDPFIDKYVSDGTIKMFAYLVLLYDPSPHPLLCVEEPENQLYPSLLWELAEEFRAYSESAEAKCLFLTHSPDFSNAVQLDEVYWLVKEQGYTQIKRAQDDPQLAAFVSEGDQMGYLWKDVDFSGELSSNDLLGIFFLKSLPQKRDA